VRELVAYWRDQFDWRVQESALNRFHQLRGEIDGKALHCIHQAGVGPAPMPLLLVHGYPDSIWRFTKLIPLLTDPGAHGGDPADAFHVVAPSLPGYGWSEARSDHGGVFGFGDLFAKLMAELGYDRYGAHGGDWGSTAVELLARSHGRHLTGIHLTDVPWWHAFNKPDDLSREEKTFLDKSQAWQMEGGAYALIQGTRPATPANALADSPAGLAAWIVEKFHEWSDCGGDVETRFSKDELLTNIMIYWTTGTIGSSFLPYRDFAKAGAARWMKEAARGWLGTDATPAAFALFPKDIGMPPRAWAERFFNVERWTEMERGGHFAAFEEPELLAEDIRSFFRDKRKADRR
jgi:microsomal epoxide hydrolase